MAVTLVRLLTDFGLLVLIWVIQLIIYPGFLYYSKDNLQVWHRKYTTLITYLVAPLMLAQLGLSLYQISMVVTLYTMASLLIISIIWLVTFLLFVPIHNAISKGTSNEEMVGSLVRKNWLRTVLWTILFVMSVIAYDKPSLF